MKTRWFLFRVALVIAALIMSVTPVAASVPAIEPQEIEALVYPGEAITIDKVVTTPEFPPQPAIVFLADTTGSMYYAIENVRVNATAVMNEIVACQPLATFAVAEYRDFGDIFVWRVNQSLTSDTTLVQDAINGWTAGGGEDWEEAQLFALKQIADGEVAFPADTTPIIAWFGDAPGHEGDPYPTTADVIASLVAAEIKVVAVDVDALDDSGQATAIANGTGGVYLRSVGSDEVSEAILEGLQNLPVEVEMVSTCEWPIATMFDPSGPVTVVSGDSVQFTETVSVSDDAEPGTHRCRDIVLINGQPMECDGEVMYEAKTIHVPGIELSPSEDVNELGVDPSHTVVATVTAGEYGPLEGVRVEFEIVDGPNAGLMAETLTDGLGQASFTYGPEVAPSSLGADLIVARLTSPEGEAWYAVAKAVKVWQDTTPPEVACLESVNPAGKVPKAPGTGQNEDGFYLLAAKDAVWPVDTLEVYVLDTGSGTVFGPYQVGTRIKYTEGRGVTPKAMPYKNKKEVDFHLIGNGDAQIIAVDGSGNEGTAMCLVPPWPK